MKSGGYSSLPHELKGGLDALLAEADRDEEPSSRFFLVVESQDPELVGEFLEEVQEQGQPSMLIRGEELLLPFSRWSSFPPSDVGKVSVQSVPRDDLFISET